MASTRPASRGGPWLALAAGVVVAACTSPNPLFNRGADDGGGDAVTGAGGSTGSGGEQSGGTGGFPNVIDTNGPAPDMAPLGTGGIIIGGTGGVSGTGGMTPISTGGVSGTGGMSRPDAGMEVAGSGGSGGMTVDTGPPPPDMVTGMPPARCGTGTVDLSNIRNARGIAIEADGTIYFTRESGAQAWIGRLRPTGTTESSWFALPANSQPRVIRLDSARQLLFVAAYNVNSVYGIRLDNATVTFAKTGLPQPHGLAVTRDGAVFVSLGDGHIKHFSPELSGVQTTQATDAMVFPTGQRPLGLALAPNGRLFVGSSNGGIKHYRVEGAKLLDGMPYGTYTGSANDLAFDVTGRLYVADHIGTTARPLVQITNNGTSINPLSQVTGQLSALAFGRGALRCDDLYVGDAAAVAHRWMAPAQGIDTP